MFRELGHPAAFVYEALEHAKTPERSFDLVTRTGLSRTAYQALETLAAWKPGDPRDGRWVLVPGKTRSSGAIRGQGCHHSLCR